MAGQLKLDKFTKFGKKIAAFGLNYKDHAAELNNPVPKEPIVFLKPTSSYIVEGQDIKLPPNAAEIHHEVELGLVIGRGGSNISEQGAMEHIGGYVLALDMTDRIRQREASKAGQPWSIAKGFDTACPVSGLITKEQLADPQAVELWLKVNGQEKQRGNTKNMIFSIPHLISFLSKYFTLEEGDLILTGTPAGVGPVKDGDVIECGLGDLMKMKFNVKG